MSDNHTTMYGSQYWTLHKAGKARLHIFESNVLLKINGPSIYDQDVQG